MVSSPYVIHKQFLVDNLAYRIGLYHPKLEVQIGTGNPEATIVVVQSKRNMPERDAITGALKRFGLLNEAYRATSTIIDYEDHGGIEYPDLIRHGQMTQDDMNQYYLRELIELIKPLVVVACGPEVMGLMRDKRVRSFKNYAGKKFKAKDLTTVVCCATLDPSSYGFARSPKALKEQGKKEWEFIAQLVEEEKQKLNLDV